MKVLADENMPFVHELFGDWAEVVTAPGRTLRPEQLRGVDALLVRSITQVNEALLSEADRLGFVGTATIGCDHVDTGLLARRGIAFASAPGCNKVAVGDYVLAALLRVAAHKQWQLAGKTLAVIGAGNTGSEVARRAEGLGMRVLRCDPPLAEAGASGLVDIDQALTADVISFHVPITHEGPYATHHLLNRPRIERLHAQQVLINACRGDVWDNHALLARQQGGSPLTLVMDVWEHEPLLLAELVPHVLIATAHIAGYSLEGKARGTFALYRALCDHGERPVARHLDELLPAPEVSAVSLNDRPDQAMVARLVRLVYDIEQDDANFRRGLASGEASFFDRLRKDYADRRELGSLQWCGVTEGAEVLGFKA
ncbi:MULTISPECIES: 4-phosphoerythronate dehydrogenase [Oceanimonas]|uniref:Erythronate-4-phosphate dehydrogenase n=1 Tax=Oceanimonas doudoroffii TaxID=84158 RepID=A0A233RF81_9GAMM|nr:MULTISPECIES: 4-phosphoerythronate dehydrogenase [Oceanimonas]NHI01569.1 Erythronate-4-phosphate dehydrogenase [Oceanimonas sp. MB9]OXY82060.1 4-phosphoerythronate dehydrogenase [Oceanimonas doudoroffii]